MKPYLQVPIQECGEPLVPIPSQQFILQQPHLYQRLGATYNGTSPFQLRRGVLDRLLQAQVNLQQRHADWHIQIFDAYRPVAVQQFMVEYTLAATAQAQGLQPERLTEVQRRGILEQVYQIWAVPNLDPAMPPPHSTGAAVDVTLVNAAGQEVFMGSPIDELSARSQPDYFAAIALDPTLEQQERDAAQVADQHRQLLQDVMGSANFQRHPTEWWHFSFGDQMWAWLTHLDCQLTPVGVAAIARYGRVGSGSELVAENLNHRTRLGQA